MIPIGVQDAKANDSLAFDAGEMVDGETTVVQTPKAAVVDGVRNSIVLPATGRKIRES